MRITLPCSLFNLISAYGLLEGIFMPWCQVIISMSDFLVPLSMLWKYVEDKFVTAHL